MIRTHLSFWRRPFFYFLTLGLSLHFSVWSFCTTVVPHSTFFSQQVQKGCRTLREQSWLESLLKVQIKTFCSAKFTQPGKRTVDITYCESQAIIFFCGVQIVEKGIICWLTPFLIFYVLSTTYTQQKQRNELFHFGWESFDIVLSCNWLLFFVVLQKSLVVKERKTGSKRNAKSQKHMMMVRHNKSLLLKKFVRNVLPNSIKVTFWAITFQASKNT